MHQTIIPMEVRLWWTREVFDMIEFLDELKCWEFVWVNNPLYNYKFQWTARSWIQSFTGYWPCGLHEMNSRDNWILLCCEELIQ